MTQSNDLPSILRRLRVSGMLATLDTRQQQAQAEQWSCAEFLARLGGDGLARRTDQALTRRVAAARFPHVTPLPTFDFRYNPKIPARQIRELTARQWIRQHQSVCFIGPVSVGKSHLVQALGFAACQQEFQVAYRKASQLFQDLSGDHADGTFERRLRFYLTVDLLIVDDFGLRDLSAQVAEDFFELVCQREQVSLYPHTRHRPALVLEYKKGAETAPVCPCPGKQVGSRLRIHDVLQYGGSYVK